MERVLITGGAGFIGSWLSRELARRGYEVIVVDDMSRGRRENFEWSGASRLIEMDLSAPGAHERLEREIGRVSVVWHLAAVNGTRFFYEQPERVFWVNTLSTREAVTYARRNAEGIVYTSSSEVYGDYLDLRCGCPRVGCYEGKPCMKEDGVLTISDAWHVRRSYALSKLAGENIVARSGIEWLTLRVFNFYGPRMRLDGYSHVVPELIQKALSPEPQVTLIGDGSQVRAFTYVEDGVRAMVDMWEDGVRGVHNLGCPENSVRIRSLAEKIVELVGTHKPVRPGKPRERDVIFRIPCPGEYSKYIQCRSLDDGLRLTVEWYRRVLGG